MSTTPVPAAATISDIPTIGLGSRVLVDRTRVHPSLALLIGVAHVHVPAEVVDVAGAIAALRWPDGYRLHIDRTALHTAPASVPCPR